MSCPVCSHPQRHLIEQALYLDVKSPRRVAVDFGLELAQVLAHQRTHVVWPRRPVAVCLPGLCEPYGSTPPGATARCRHCDTPLVQEIPHA